MELFFSWAAISSAVIVLFEILFARRSITLVQYRDFSLIAYGFVLGIIWSGLLFPVTAPDWVRGMTAAFVVVGVIVLRARVDIAVKNQKNRAADRPDQLN